MPAKKKVPTKAEVDAALKLLSESNADYMITFPDGSSALSGVFKATHPDTTLPDTPARPLAVQIAGTHYKDFAIQPVEFLERNKGMLSYSQENIIKYTCRLGRKGGLEGTMTDLAKIRHYLDLYEQLNGVPTPV